MIRGAVLAFLIPSLLFVWPGCAPKEAIRKPSYKRAGVSEETETPTRGAGYHVIKKGETLYGVARRYGVSVGELKKLNRITDVRDIDAGTRLYIPPRRSRSAKKRAAPPRKEARSPVSTSVRFIWPVKGGRVTSRFGTRSSGRHDGIDISARKGTTIQAAAEGKIIFSGRGPSGYGNMVIIKHDRATITIYAHNDRNLVRKNEYVKRGQGIATVGRTGRADGPHVHFEIRIDRKPVNPAKYLP